MVHHSKRRRFLIDALEQRLLMSYAAYVQVNSPLETTSGSNAITVLPGQPVSFTVTVTGYQIGDTVTLG
jgi:hypothetical protein